MSRPSRLPSVLSPLARSFAALASGVPLFRPGSPLPGANAPLAGAPGPDTAGHTHAGRRPLRRTLRLSAAEGMGAEVFNACAGATVLTAWAVTLGLGPFLVGLMTAMPFFAQFVQFPAAGLTSLFGHRRVALVAVGLSRVAVLPLCLVPWLPLGHEGQQRLLVAVAAASALLAVVGNNAWVAWMGEVVPASVRGRYFGRRTALCTLAGTLGSLCVGLWLDGARRAEALEPALPLLALGAVGLGAVTTLLMVRQHDPAQGRPRALRSLGRALFPLREVLLTLRDARSRGVLVYQLAFNAAVGLAAPFFALHMMRNLRMSFVLMALHGAAIAGVRILTAPMWGRLIDRAGTRPVLFVCSAGMSTIPALWLLPTQDNLWPLLVDVVLAGTFWGGHGLAAFALPLEVAPRGRRPFYLAAFATAGGLAYALASSASGALASALPAHFTLAGREWANIHVLFALSSLARAATASLALRLPEVGAPCPGGALVVVRRLVLAPARPVEVLLPARVPTRPAA